MELKQFLDIVIPILLGVLGIMTQKLWEYIKISQYNLKYHKLISDIGIYIQKINTWTYKENRQVFIDALLIKLKVWQKSSEELAKEINNKYIPRQRLENMLLQWATDTIEQYIKEWERSEIPKDIIKHINNIHQEKVDLFINEIKNVIMDKTYPNGQYVKREIFNILRLLLSETKDDFNDIIYREIYNGRFKGIYYKNIPISDIEFKKIKDNENNK